MKNFLNFINENLSKTDFLDDLTLWLKNGKNTEDAFFKKYIDVDVDYFKDLEYDKIYEEIILTMDKDCFENMFNIDIAYLSVFIDLNSNYPNYEYEVGDEYFNYFNDENIKTYNKILKLFNIDEHNYYFSLLCSISKKSRLMLTNIDSEITYSYNKATIEDADKLWNELPYYFDKLNKDILKIGVDIDNIKTTIYNLISESQIIVEKIETFTYEVSLVDSEFEELNENLKKLLNDLYDYFLNNKKDLLKNLIKYDKYEINRFRQLGGDIEKYLKSFEFQKMFIENGDDKLKKYIDLKDIEILNPDIKKKYEYLIKIRDFNI